MCFITLFFFLLFPPFPFFFHEVLLQIHPCSIWIKMDRIYIPEWELKKTLREKVKKGGGERKKVQK